jgi:hypothetical protein
VHDQRSERFTCELGMLQIAQILLNFGRSGEKVAVRIATEGPLTGARPIWIQHPSFSCSTKTLTINYVTMALRQIPVYHVRSGPIRITGR